MCYLVPYIFRVAISNQHILKLAGGKVTFRYFAPETGKPRTCTVTAMEFIRRFLQPVLPKGFVKVRCYGFFAPRFTLSFAGHPPAVACPATNK
ncbi:MAG: hypothetical protein D6816_13490 [Bacteroidetes bacterium]|nr:MAG: hypothetical protein D6816_13490 [Bacteroidota bacterium]